MGDILLFNDFFSKNDLFISLAIKCTLACPKSSVNWQSSARNHRRFVTQQEQDWMDNFVNFCNKRICEKVVAFFKKRKIILPANLPNGILDFIGSALAGSDHPMRPIFVITTVGFTQFTRMLWGPNSKAITLVMLSNAPFVPQ